MVNKLHYQTKFISIFDENTDISADVVEIVSDTEHLDEIDFATHANWDVTNDWDDSGANATFTWASNITSTLTQVNGDMALAPIGLKQYTLVYTCTVATAPDGDLAMTLTTGISDTAVDLAFTAGTHTYTFTTKHTPGDFVISVVSGTDTEGTFTITAISLKQSGTAVSVKGAQRVAVLFKTEAATLTKAVTLKMYRVLNDYSSDVAIPFSISEVTTAGVYGTWSDCTAAVGKVFAAADLKDANHMFLIEIEPLEFKGTDDFSTDTTYLDMKLTQSTQASVDFVGSATAILYGLPYKT